MDMESRVLNRISALALDILVDQLSQHNDFRIWSFDRVQCCMAGDTVNERLTMDRNLVTSIPLQHFSAQAFLPDVLAEGDKLRAYINPALVSLGLSISKEANKQLGTCCQCGSAYDLALVTRRVPLPLPGCGVLAQYAELGNFGFRTVIYYNSTSLRMNVEFDVFFGVGRIPRTSGTT